MPVLYWYYPRCRYCRIFLALRGPFLSVTPARQLRIPWYRRHPLCEIRSLKALTNIVAVSILLITCPYPERRRGQHKKPPHFQSKLREVRQSYTSCTTRRQNQPQPHGIRGQNQPQFKTPGVPHGIETVNEATGCLQHDSHCRTGADIGRHLRTLMWNTPNATSLLC